MFHSKLRNVPPILYVAKSTLTSFPFDLFLPAGSPSFCAPFRVKLSKQYRQNENRKAHTNMKTRNRIEPSPDVVSRHRATRTTVSLLAVIVAVGTLAGAITYAQT